MASTHVRLSWLAPLLLSGALAAPAQASYIGGTVSANYVYGSDILYASGSVVAGAGLEFDNIAGFGLTADFSDNTVTLTYPGGWTFGSPASFDGWVFSDEGDTVPTITGAMLVSTNIVGLVADVSFDADHVRVNQNRSDPTLQPGSFTIQVTFAQVPEPASWALAAIALFGIGARRERLNACP